MIDNKYNLVKVPDSRYKVWLDISIKSTKIYKINSEVIQVFRDQWHPKIDKELIEKGIKERLKVSNYVSRGLHHIVTINNKGGIEEGFVLIPKYMPDGFRIRHTNPYIHYLYKVEGDNLFYFR